LLPKVREFKCGPGGSPIRAALAPILFSSCLQRIEVAVGRSIFNLRESLDYAVDMKFRTKFGPQGWFVVSLACAYGYVVLLSPRGSPHSAWGFTAAVWVWWAFLRILSYLFTYWELDSSSLRQHSYWSTKEVAWEEVTHVGGLNGRPSSAVLEVDYARPAPMSDRGHILASPEDRQQFIAALRRFAPQAAFEV
jgi:hypothetical protein